MLGSWGQGEGGGREANGGEGEKGVSGRENCTHKGLESRELGELRVPRWGWSGGMLYLQATVQGTVQVSALRGPTVPPSGEACRG